MILLINELENDGTVNSNQGSISCENKDKIDQCINFNQKIKSLEETIAKQNKKLDDLFNKLSDDKINITKTNPPTKYIHFFYIRTSKFCLRLTVLNFFFIFEAEMFLICSYFPD